MYKNIFRHERTVLVENVYNRSRDWKLFDIGRIHYNPQPETTTTLLLAGHLLVSKSHGAPLTSGLAGSQEVQVNHT